MVIRFNTATSHGVHQEDIPAPWRCKFQEDIAQMEGQEFAFATMHATIPNKQASCPRVRFCAFRCFWAELPDNPNNPATLNKPTFTSDMPCFTTDVRTSKISELFTTIGSGDVSPNENHTSGSGGGGPCEAVWWARDSLTQWRFKGEAFVIAPDIEVSSMHCTSPAAAMVKRQLIPRMRVIDKKGVSEWSWKQELTAHFGNLPPGKRGRFVAPPPGQPVDQPYDHENFGIGREINDLEHPVARRNFRVVVIRPEEVESVDLADPKTARRHVYKFDINSGQWSHQECWP